MPTASTSTAPAFLAPVPGQTVAVLDFETTGIAPESGSRATEIGIVLLRDGEIVDRYQSLMNAGVWVPPYIEELTGISNRMVRAAPPAAQVMREAARFVDGHPLVAHNAAFDRRFWDLELARLQLTRRQDFACTLLLSRRLFPQAANHRLETLARYARLPDTGRAHRALADAETTAHLVVRLQETLRDRFRLAAAPHELLCSVQQAPRHGLEQCVHRFRTGNVGDPGPRARMMGRWR